VAPQEPVAAKEAPATPARPEREEKPAESAPAVAVQSVSAVPEESPPQIDEGEIAVLVKRGQDALTNGDLASARLLLNRAAAAGSAKAALALGATYDPLVIRRLGAVGAEPDAERARKWYQKAQELGSDAASEQLAKLDQTRR